MMQLKVEACMFLEHVQEINIGENETKLSIFQEVAMGEDGVKASE